MLIYLLVICNEDLNIIDILLCQDKHIVSNFQVFQSTSISQGREGWRWQRQGTYSYKIIVLTSREDTLVVGS